MDFLPTSPRPSIPIPDARCAPADVLIGESFEGSPSELTSAFYRTPNHQLL